MPEMRKKSLLAPDETIEFDHGRMTSVQLGDVTVGHEILEPGWRWSVHLKPEVGTDWCMSRHVGLQLSGRWMCLLSDGTMMEFGPNDVFDVPAGHDAWVLGDEPAVSLDWEGLRTWATPIGVGERVLRTHPVHRHRRVDLDRRGDRRAGLERPARPPQRGGPSRDRSSARTGDRDDRGRVPGHLRRRRLAPSGARSTSGMAPGRWASTCARASTPARSTSSARRCAASPSTRRPGSLPPPPRARSSSPRSPEPWPAGPDCGSRIAAGTTSKASKGIASSSPRRRSRRTDRRGGEEPDPSRDRLRVLRGAPRTCRPRPSC